MIAPAPGTSSKKAAKAKAPSSHPPMINMICAAITASKDTKGSSLPTIKKYIAANYKFDVEKHAAHIRRAIVHGVDKNTLIRVGNKGKGASGSFKVAAKKPTEGKPKVSKPKSRPAKSKAKSTPKKPKVKKTSKPKVKKAKKLKSPKPKKSAAKKPRTSKKAKKAAKKK